MSVNDVRGLAGGGAERSAADTSAGAVEAAPRGRGAEQRDSAHDESDDRIAVLAHELRNPLAALANVAELLSSKATGEPALEQIAHILRRQTSVMRVLVEELLDVSRLDHERLKLRLRKLDLRDVVRNAVDDHRRQIERAGLSFELVLDSRPVAIEADQVKLAQVLGNLLSNALKFTPAPGTVHVAVTADAGAAQVVVRDSGAGIAPEMLPEIFEPYRQASRGRHGGLGLGLPIARGLMELHGGSITAVSAGLGCGTTMTLRLPLADVDSTWS